MVRFSADRLEFPQSLDRLLQGGPKAGKDGNHDQADHQGDRFICEIEAECPGSKLAPENGAATINADMPTNIPSVRNWLATVNELAPMERITPISLSRSNTLIERVDSSPITPTAAITIAALSNIRPKSAMIWVLPQPPRMCCSAYGSVVSENGARQARELRNVNFCRVSVKRDTTKDWLTLIMCKRKLAHEFVPIKGAQMC